MDRKDFTIAVITLSDRVYNGTRADLSGPAIQDYLEKAGFQRGDYALIPDDGNKLKKLLLDYADRNYDLVLTTGGTGFADRDITPEVTLSIADKIVPGIAEAIRAESLKITPHAMLSRGVAVIRKKTLIINLAGAPKACKESLDVIIDALPHGLGLLKGEKLDK
ncbi:MogA/MoaB family molybdenum cofactor biosynthesis protein [Pleomorphochaeta sp. DL1XJH-081]|uniref:MogA/MoaB family molybdenum cofactor biosynthesis protein n=1 Tax=Pleomorphochaeta sp. DL1XJH-081 TaxID=3409690 RepID=UPI003BB5CA6F